MTKFSELHGRDRSISRGSDVAVDGRPNERRLGRCQTINVGHPWYPPWGLARPGDHGPARRRGATVLSHQVEQGVGERVRPVCGVGRLLFHRLAQRPERRHAPARSRRPLHARWPFAPARALRRRARASARSTTPRPPRVGRDLAREVPARLGGEVSSPAVTIWTLGSESEAASCRMALRPSERLLGAEGDVDPLALGSEQLAVPTLERVDDHDRAPGVHQARVAAFRTRPARPAR